MRASHFAIRRLAGVALALALLTGGCTSAGVRSELEQGRVLAASGRLAEAYQSLEASHRAHPSSRELEEAASTTRQRYGEFLAQRAEAARAAGRADDARALFQQLAGVPGFEARAARGIEQAAAQPAAPAASSSSSAATAAPSTSAAAVPLPPVVREPVSAAPAPFAAPAPAAAPVPPAPAVAAPALDPLDRPVTLEFRDAPVRSMFDAITRASGLNVIFDRDVSPDLRTTVYLRNTTVRAAIEKIVLTSGLAWRSLDEQTLLVYADDPGKQADYQALTVRAFQLQNADAKFVANSLRTVLKFRDLVVDEKLNMIVVRDTPPALAMAEKLVALHDAAEPEVMLEVAVLEVSKENLQNLGVKWPGSMALTPLARTAAATTSTTSSTTSSSVPLTLRDLWGLTPGSLGLTIDSLAVNANATDTNVNMLANPRIRAKNREKAKILIGERVPNVSSTTSNGVVNQSITYTDVGLKLDVEPQIFPGNEIALKISLEVSSINSTMTNAATGLVAYRIGTRNASTVLRLKDGENQILAGLIQDTDKKTLNKVPLLGDIPLLGRLFSSDSTDKVKNEIVLSITPRLIRGNAVRDAASFEAGTVSGLRGRRPEGDAAGSAEVLSNGAAATAAPATQSSEQNSQRQNVDSSARSFGGSRD